MNDFPENVRDLIGMASLYFGDGAAQTAADRLKKAAEEVQKIADGKAAYIAETVKK